MTRRSWLLLLLVGWVQTKGFDVRAGRWREVRLAFAALSLAASSATTQPISS